MRSLVVLLAAGCLPSKAVELPLEFGEIAIGVVLESGVAPVTVVVTSGAELPLSFGEDTQLFLWPLRLDDFVHADGSPVLQDELTSVSVRFAGGDPSGDRGSCRRCLAPFGTPPQPVYPGDSCAIPSFAAERLLAFDRNGAIEVDTGVRTAAEELRLSLRLDWPGECACEDVALEQDPQHGWKFEPARPGVVEAWPYEEWAIHPDGTVAGFNERRAIVLFPGRAPEIHALPPELLDDVGPVLGAVAIDTFDGRTAFVAATTSTDLIVDSTHYFLIEVDPEFRVRTFNVDSKFHPFAMKYVDPSHFMMIGGVQNTVVRDFFPAFAECTVDAAGIDCVLRGELVNNGCIFHSLELIDLEFFGSAPEKLVGTLRYAGLVVGVKNGDRWELACVDTKEFTLGGRTRNFAEANPGGAAAFDNGRAYVCLTLEAPRAIVTADFSAATTLQEMIDVEWNTAVEIPADYTGTCEDFAEGPGPDRVTLVTSSHQVGTCRADGTCTATVANEFTGVPPPRVLLTPVDGWTLGFEFGYSNLQHPTQVFRRRDGGRFERVYGPEIFDPTIVAPLALGLDGHPRHFAAYSIIRFERTPEGTVETSTTVLPGLFSLYDVALDSSDGSFVGLAGYKILRIWEDPPRFEVIAEIPPLLADECVGSTVLTRIVEANPGEHIAIEECGFLARIVGSDVTVERVEDWDDPMTVGVEGREQPPYFKSLAASKGTVWIGGRNGALMRVHGAHHERFSLERTFEDGAYHNFWLEGLAVDAIRAFCPDRVLFGSGVQYFHSTTPNADELASGRLPLEASQLKLRRIEGSTLRQEFSKLPRAIVGPAHSYVVLQTNAWALQYQRPPQRSLIEPDDAVEDKNGIIWLGGPDRRLVLGEPVN